MAMQYRKNITFEAQMRRNLENGTAFLTASRAMEQSQEGERWGGGHGAFTWRLVEGLRKAGDLNQDGRVTIDELAEYVGNAVKKKTNGKRRLSENL